MSDLCCCHGLDDPCMHNDPERHRHYCLPVGLDLGGHCPDDGCPGRCWAPPKQTTATDPHLPPVGAAGESERSSDE